MSQDRIEKYFAKEQRWKEELTKLRAILKKTELNEELKWGMPCYTLNGKLVCGLAGFKNHYGIWFFQGVFLQDEEGLLVNAQEGKTQAMRQMRLDADMRPSDRIIKKYISEAIENTREGKEVKVERKKLVIPEMLKSRLAADATLNDKFKAFSTGKKREFAEYITEAKRESTKLSRLEKIIPMIMEGRGLNDKYRK